MLVDVLKNILLTAGIIIIAHKLLLKYSSREPYQKISLISLGLLAALSIATYTNFFRFNQYGSYGNHSYHYHDIYHYFLGAKYYQEIKYDRLYDCTYTAFKELGQEGVKIPSIVAIRSLKNPDHSYMAETRAAENRERCVNSFHPERWREFKQDLSVFLSLGWVDHWWRVMLFDLGFNPPPSWAVLATPLANLVPFSSLSMELLPFLDFILVFVVAGFFVGRAFGLFHLFSYYLILGTNWYASYAWIGGSFFRQVWFFFLVLAVCFLKMKKYKLSGLFFGLTTSLRLFPAAFFLGALWPLVFSAFFKPSHRKSVLSLSLVFLGTILSTVILSLLIFGPEYWLEFFDKIVKHNNTFFVMHFGFKKFAAFSEDIVGQNFWWAEGLQRFSVWNEQLKNIYNAHVVFYTSLQWAIPFAAFYVFKRYPPYFTSVALGGILLFFFSMPANYYYLYLALFPVVALHEEQQKRNLSTILGILGILLWINLMPFTTDDQLLYNGYVNRILFGFFVGLVVLGFIESSSRIKNWISQCLPSLIKPS